MGWSVCVGGAVCVGGGRVCGGGSEASITRGIGQGLPMPTACDGAGGENVVWLAQEGRVGQVMVGRGEGVGGDGPWKGYVMGTLTLL